MTPQELKNSILQLAIQGKLVEQRAEEGTGRELLEKILVAKMQRTQRRGKGRLTRSRGERGAAPTSAPSASPRDEIPDDEKPFDIPDSWEWVHINQVADTSLGKTMDKVKNTGDFCPYLCSINVYWDGVSLEKIKEARFTVEDKQKYLLKKGDLLICEGGDVGRSAIWNHDKEMYYQNALHRVRFYDGVIPRYFRFLIECYKWLGIIERYCKGVTIKHLVQKSLCAIYFPLPPLAEQKRIVAKIEELLPLIDRYEKAWSRLESFNKSFPVDMQKSILQMAIQGKLVEQRPEEGTGEELYRQIQVERERLIKNGAVKVEKPFDPISDDEKPFEIPENWTWVRFGNLGSYKKGPFGSALTKSIFVTKGADSVKVYEQKNAIQKDATLGEYYIRRDYFETKMSGFEVHSGDVIVSCAGTIGETYVLPEGIEQGIINQALMRMKIFVPMYVPYFLMFFDVVLKQSARANSKGSAIKNIPPFEILKNYLVPLPPLAEQKRIVAKLEELLPLCERLKAKSGELSQPELSKRSEV